MALTYEEIMANAMKIYEERNVKYGPITLMAKKVAALLSNLQDTEVDPRAVLLVWAASKQVRLAQNSHDPDHVYDAINYFAGILMLTSEQLEATNGQDT